MRHLGRFSQKYLTPNPTIGTETFKGKKIKKSNPK